MKQHKNSLFVLFTGACVWTSFAAYADLPPGELGAAIGRYNQCVESYLQQNQGNISLSLEAVTAQCAEDRDAVATQAGETQQASVLAELDAQTAVLLPRNNVNTYPAPQDMAPFADAAVPESSADTGSTDGTSP